MAGRSLRLVRSPDAPKMTSAAGSGVGSMRRPSSNGLGSPPAETDIRATITNVCSLQLAVHSSSRRNGASPFPSTADCKLCTVLRLVVQELQRLLRSEHAELQPGML